MSTAISSFLSSFLPSSTSTIVHADESTEKDVNTTSKAESEEGGDTEAAPAEEEEEEEPEDVSGYLLFVRAILKLIIVVVYFMTNPHILPQLHSLYPLSSLSYLIPPPPAHALHPRILPNILQMRPTHQTLPTL